jgi:hypothetical protein
MFKKIAFISIPLISLALTGCSVFMPYSSNLGPRRGTNQGYIGSVSQVYNRTLNHGTKKYPLLQMPGEKPLNGAGSKHGGSVYNRSLYYQFKNNLLMSLIGKRPTPIYEPPVILRVLMLPYVDKSGVLHSYQYAYFVAQKGRWLLGSYLNRAYNNRRVFNPLSGNIQSAPVNAKTNIKSAQAAKAGPKTGFFGTGKPKAANPGQTVFQNDLKSAQAAKAGMSN